MKVWLTTVLYFSTSEAPTLTVKLIVRTVVTKVTLWCDGSFYAAPMCPLFMFPSNYSGSFAVWANVADHSSFHLYSNAFVFEI